MPTIQATRRHHLRNKRSHLIARAKKVRLHPIGCEATPEELELIRQAREEYARGEYYSKLPGETFEEFFARIDADPIGTMACNQPGWKQAHA